MELLNDLMSNATTLAATMIPVIMIFVQLIKKSRVDSRWLPHISILIGAIAGLLFGWQLEQSLFLYALAGVISGAGASGLYDAGKSTKGE